MPAWAEYPQDTILSSWCPPSLTSHDHSLLSRLFDVLLAIWHLPGYSAPSWLFMAFSPLLAPWCFSCHSAYVWSIAANLATQYPLSRLMASRPTGTLSVAWWPPWRLAPTWYFVAPGCLLPSWLLSIILTLWQLTPSCLASSHLRRLLNDQHALSHWQPEHSRINQLNINIRDSPYLSDFDENSCIR